MLFSFIALSFFLLWILAGGAGIRRVAGLPTGFLLCAFSGLITGALIVFAFSSFSIAALIFTAVALYGARTVWRSSRSARPLFLNRGFWGTGAFAIFWLFLIFRTPVGDWDAQASWLFRGHVFAINGGLWPESWWSTKPYEFVRWDYPALFSTWTGWTEWSLANVGVEGSPKLAVGLFFSICFVGLLSFRREGWGWFWLLISVFASFHRYLWNGYLDGFVAIIYGFGLVGTERWRREGDQADLGMVLGAIAILPLMKLEGLALSGTLALFLLFSGVRRLWWEQQARRELFFWAGLGLSALVLWSVQKHRIGVEPWLQAEGALQIATRRWNEGWAARIMERLIVDGWTFRGWILVFILSVTAMIAKRFQPRDLRPLLPTIPYLCILWVVYMITPIDLELQLSVSQDRVVYPLRMASFVSLMLVAESLFAKRPRKETV